jgi:glucose-1-phosphate thymidylyltransferase
LKGIILAGGKGTRLYPATIGISKQLLPVYNKPMIYYPLTTLMMAGIKEIMVITTQEDSESYIRILGTGEQWGIRLVYAIQVVPRGLADAFIVGKNFLRDEDSSALVLGDNIFFGHDLSRTMANAPKHIQKYGGAMIFGYPVADPERYGIVEVDHVGRALSIEEKPKTPKSRLAVPGIYFYDKDVLEIAANVKPSPRGEIEITDINKVYLERKKLVVHRFGRGMAWLDAGTHESLMQASGFIQAVEERQGMVVGSPEEVAYRMGFIDKDQFARQAEKFKGSSYGACLHRVLEEGSNSLDEHR